MHNYIYGTNTVLDFLKHSPKKGEKLYIKETKHGVDIDEIKFFAKTHRIPVSFATERDLDKICPDVNHQGIIMLAKDFEYTELEDFIKKSKEVDNSCVIILDEIEDPQNLGAILRSAAALGMSAVITPKHRSCPITGAVYKTGAGTIGKIPIIRVGNINQSLEKLKEAHFWSVSLSGESSQELNSVDLKGNIVFIIGNEGRGVSLHTNKASDFKCKIPMHNEVESLNASVCAALCMYEWRRQNN